MNATVDSGQMVLPSASDVLEVIPLNDREWWVCDRRSPAHDEGRGLAYISRLNDSRFMVTGLAAERGWMLFQDYGAAIDAICAWRLGRSEQRRAAAA
jgi:hypothetical protein